MVGLTLYRANGACSLVVHALLRELQIPFESVLMQMTPAGIASVDGNLLTAEYKATVHHMGYVPALKLDDDSIITETPAILAYVASLAPDRQLTGADGLPRVRVIEWLNWLSGALHGQGFGMRFQPKRFTDDETLFAAIRQRGFDFVGKAFERVDSVLKGKEFAVGDSDTLADFYLVIFWYWGNEIGYNMQEKFPNYGRLIQRMEAKESVNKVVQMEGKKLSFAAPM